MEGNTSARTRTWSEVTGQVRWTSCCRVSGTPSVSAMSGASPTCATATEAAPSSYPTASCCCSSGCRSSSWSCPSASSAAAGHLPAGRLHRYSKVKHTILQLITITTSYTPISSKMARQNQGIKQTRNRKTMRESTMDGWMDVLLCSCYNSVG